MHMLKIKKTCGTLVASHSFLVHIPEVVSESGQCNCRRQFDKYTLKLTHNFDEYLHRIFIISTYCYFLHVIHSIGLVLLAEAQQLD